MTKQCLARESFATEWALLQNQFDSYEKFSLVIKLISIVIVALASMTNHLNQIIVLLLLVLWLQDAIWKTFQGRTESRLLQLEKLLSNDTAAINGCEAYQFNQQYLSNRPSSLGLITEYCRQAIRPTIAFPYLILLIICAVKLLF